MKPCEWSYLGAQCPGESGETDGSLMLNDFLPEVEEIEEEVMEKLKFKVKVIVH